MPLEYTFLSIILKPGIEVYTKMKYFFTTFALKVSVVFSYMIRQGDVSFVIF